jgi:hypothetical protein
MRYDAQELALTHWEGHIHGIRLTIVVRTPLGSTSRLPR